jgi:hypothetical protein
MSPLSMTLAVYRLNPTTGERTEVVPKHYVVTEKRAAPPINLHVCGCPIHRGAVWNTNDCPDSSGRAVPPGRAVASPCVIVAASATWHMPRSSGAPPGGPVLPPDRPGVRIPREPRRPPLSPRPWWLWLPAGR